MDERIEAAGQGHGDELLELIVDSATDFAIYTTDPQGIATSWNVGAERLFGFTYADMIGHSGDVIFTPADQAAGVPDTERRTADVEGRALDERWHQRKDGSRFWASGLLMPLRNGAGYVKIARDRTEQHEAERHAREQDARFKLLATSVPQLVFTTFADGGRTWPSPQWIDFTGRSFDDSLGQGWLEAIHPDDREQTRTAWDAAIVVGNITSNTACGMRPKANIAGTRRVHARSPGRRTRPNGSGR